LGQQGLGPAASRAARPAAATYRISGKVVDAHTAAPLGRCSVQIADVKERSKTLSTISGDDGSFVFEGLPLGKYSLTAVRRGYLEQAYEEHDAFSTAIAVGPGLVSENLLFKLTAEAVITGTITDEAGEPIRGAQVRLFEDQDLFGIRSTRQRSTVISDDRGVYEFPEVRPGAYFLVVTARPWYAQRVRQIQQAEGEQGGGTQPLDVAYPTTFYPGATDQDGATPIPIKGGERVEANLTLTPLPALRLHVNAARGESEPRTSVMLTQSLFGQTESLPVQMTFTPGGSVDLEGILPGHYDVTLSTYGTDGRAKGETKHFETDVSGGATELSEDGGVGEIAVTGKVTVAVGKLPPSAGIVLSTARGRQQHYGPLNETGEFTVSVPPGSYEVIGNMSEMYIASAKATGASLTGRMLTVKTGDAPKLEIVAGTGHGEVEGTAFLGEKPVSAVMVLLAPEDPGNNQILFRRDQSDSDGTFDIGNIVPGRYRLLAIERGWELEWANPAVLQAFLAKSVPVEVKAGDHLKQRVEVQER
jgi:hypothetical protein